MESASQEMTRVDFYLLESTGPQSRLHFACRIAEKAYRLSNTVYAHTQSDQTARQFDDLLWQFRQGSFVPHEVITDEAAAAPVRIGTASHMLEEGDVLINLTGDAPPFAEQFTRVAEIVTGDETSKAEARERYLQYKAMGIEPTTHHIDG